MMRRSPLKRTTPLRARRWGIKRKPARRLLGPGADPVYLTFVRSLPCCAMHLGRCRGAIEANHARANVGVGRKAPDREAFPLCHQHHQDFHDARGAFKSWNREQRREFEASCIAAVKLLAVPDTLADGRVLEALGLGRLSCEGGRWFWTPGVAS